MGFFDGRELSPLGFCALGAACSLVAGACTVLLARRAASLRLVSRHRRDRFGRGHVPLTAGPGLFAGVAVVLLGLGFPVGPGEVVAVLGFFLAGLLDDLRPLRPAPKFALQGAVALSAAFLLAPSPAYAGLAAVVFLVLVNASNYLDNMDALLPGVALVQAVTLVFLLRPAPTTGGALLVWGLPAVLFLTLPPARTYLGDSGSHLVGALLALDVGAHLFGPEGVRGRAVLPLLVLFAVPLADVATVTVSRLRRGRPVFRGGTDHLSHRLVRLGFPVPRAVLVLVLASGACGVASLLLAHSS